MSYTLFKASSLKVSKFGSCWAKISLKEISTSLCFLTLSCAIFKKKHSNRNERYNYPTLITSLPSCSSVFIFIHFFTISSTVRRKGIKLTSGKYINLCHDTEGTGVRPTCPLYSLLAVLLSLGTVCLSACLYSF